MSQEEQTGGLLVEGGDTKEDLFISNGGPPDVVAHLPQAETAAVAINPDVEKAAAGDEKDEDSPFESAKLDVTPAANGIPDASASASIVPTEVDLAELEKAAQKNDDETPNISQQDIKESAAIKDEKAAQKNEDETPNITQQDNIEVSAEIKDEDDSASIQTEESNDENSDSSSESDSDSSDSDEDSNSDGSSSSSSSSSSSEDPSVIPDMEDDEEQAMLRRDQVYPQSSLMYGDDDAPLFSSEDELRHAFEFRFGDRATVRRMIAQRIKGKHRQKLARDEYMRNNGTLGPSGRIVQRERVNQRKKRVLYAIIASAIITVGISLVIYAVTKEREYNRSEEFANDEEDHEAEVSPEKPPTVTILHGPTITTQPRPQQSPVLPPSQIQPPTPPNNDSALLTLIKMAYIDTFQSIPGTSGTNQASVNFVDEVENKHLNPSVNSGQTQSYQWQAYLYLYNSRTDIINKQTNQIDMPAERIMQIYALYCFYIQVQFPQEGTNECDWSGVTCRDMNDKANSPYSVTSDMVVVSLELPKWQLKGTVPAELAFLPYVETIDLSDNQLSGPLPTLAMFKWSRLKVLSLHDNQFNCGLSSEIGHLTNLQKLTIYHNQFQGGTIPMEVCHLREGQLHFLWADCSTSSTSNFKVSCPVDCCTICFEPVGFGHDSEVSIDVTDQLTHETHGVDPNGVMLNKLKAQAADGGLGLDDLDSPQYKSYVWLVTHSNYEDVPDLIVSQKYALATLYFALAGTGWYQNTGWLTDDDVCSWFGVSDCHGGTSSSLNLSSNNLVGMIPLELMSLRTLKSINFADNALYGVIPPDIGTFDFLEILLLDNNVLSGEIPSELGNISTLKQLTLNSNELKGEVPAGVCSLQGSGLVELWADCLGPEVTCECCTKCYRYGEVHSIIEDAPPPDTIEQSYEENAELKSMLIKHMTGLEANPLSDKESPSYKAYLWLSNSSNLSDLDTFRMLRRFGLMSLYLATTPVFSWKIDSGWKTNDHECNWYGVTCDGNEVAEISLPSNRLSGTIPPEFALGGLGGKVAVLDLSENSIGGSLPSEMGDFHNLNILDLKDNAFTGAIPSELKQLTKLVSLRLHSNNFEGAMPAEVCSLRADALDELSADCDPDDPFDHVTCDTETCCTICY
jgi:Leucine-rich repeat (LRR) protein